MRALTVRAESFAPPHGRLGVSPVRALQWALLVLILGKVGTIPALDLGDRVAPILLNDLAVAVVVGVAAVAMMQSRSLRLNDVAMAGLVFACIGGLATLAGVQRFGLSALEVAGSLAYLARWLLYFALYIVVINCMRAS